MSEGGTRYKLQKKRIRDADGNVIGYGDPKPAVKKKGSDMVTKGAYPYSFIYSSASLFV